MHLREKYVLAIGLSALAMAGTANAQRALSVEEVAICAGESGQIELVLDAKDAAKRRLQNMSVNRSSASSVDRYNDAVAASNALVNLGNRMIDGFHSRCAQITVSKSAYDIVCQQTNLNRNYGSTSFCRQFNFGPSASLNGEEGGSPAVQVSFTSAAMSTGSLYSSGVFDEPAEADPFPFLLGVEEDNVTSQTPALDRRLNRMPRDRNLKTPD